MSKLIETFVLVTGGDMAIMKASGMSEESIRLMVSKAAERAIANKLAEIQREAFEVQMQEINNRIFNNGEAV